MSDLVDHLSARGAGHAAAFQNRRTIRCAINQEFADPSSPVHPGDEVAFFPPVTGGEPDHDQTADVQSIERKARRTLLNLSVSAHASIRVQVGPVRDDRVFGTDSSTCNSLLQPTLSLRFLRCCMMILAVRNHIRRGCHAVG